MARVKTIEAFGYWIKEEENAQRVLDLVAGGTTLQKVSTVLKQPYTCLHEFFHRPENLPRYEAARKAWADAKQDEALELADNVAADRDAVAKAKLQVETRANQAKAYHRERWGDKVQVEKSVAVMVDAGPATRLLRELQEKEVAALPAVIEAHGQPAG